MTEPAGPTDVIWDVTYACPLRCGHCYSESGRRPTRQLSTAELLAVADAMAAWRPRSVTLSGGEPLLVPGLFDVAARLRAAGAELSLYTSGWRLDEATAVRAGQAFDRIAVSVDGADAEVHDKIRGRRGSFDRAMAALGLLDGLGTDACPFGIDYTVVRSNLHQIPRACVEFGARFPRLSAVLFGAAVPTGLASRADYAERELLDRAECERLVSKAHVGELRAAARPGLRVAASDNRLLQMHPDHVRGPADFPVAQVEPDGEVRAMATYEGTVGNLRTDDPAEIWRRAVARWRDPFVVETLTPARTTLQWAAATRRIDQRFASPAEGARLARRPAYR